MSDLISMIDDTTERLLKKIDDIKFPQSDKKYVTIEKEVWESTLKASMDRAGEIETLQKQLDIAVKALEDVATFMTCDEVEIQEIQPEFCADQAALDRVNEAMKKIKELDK